MGGWGDEKLAENPDRKIVRAFVGLEFSSWNMNVIVAHPDASYSDDDWDGPTHDALFERVRMTPIEDNRERLTQNKQHRDAILAVVNLQLVINLDLICVSSHCYCSSYYGSPLDIDLHTRASS